MRCFSVVSCHLNLSIMANVSLSRVVLSFKLKFKYDNNGIYKPMRCLKVYQT